MISEQPYCLLCLFFNTDLLLIGVDSVFHAVWIFIAALFAMFAFAALTQGFFAGKNKWYDGILLAVVTLTLLRADLFNSLINKPDLPSFFINLAGMGLMILVYLNQRLRIKRSEAKSLITIRGCDSPGSALLFP